VRDVTERVEAQAERERLKAQAERERLERQLHQSQRLESLGQLAGGVAHDFNNLLSVILNYSTFVTEELENESWTEERRAGALRDVEQIRNAANRAAALTHQLLAFARREVIRPRVMELNEVVADVRQMLRRTLGEHITLITNLSPVPGLVLADPGQLEQVLVNLAVNARDAMPTGGTISIETERVTVGDPGTATAALPAGPYVQLRITDTGCGMPRDVIDRAFEPFFTTKPKGQGTGLGLATVYGIVTQAGGSIRISSTPSHGTTITMLFPVTDQPQEAPKPVAAAPVSRGGETVLLVEDEDALREVTYRILTRNGYHVVSACNGPTALAAARELTTVDLLLTDVVMPEMVGKELAERLRAVRPDTRVLYMSGYAQPILTSQGVLDPAVTLLAKPFTETDLLGEVRSCLDTGTVPVRTPS
jgi:signal transduction histidine kinase/ActR/RegA family two-component response regulator